MRYAPLLVAALCLIVLFPGLDRVGWLDAREASDAQVAGEVTGRRELLTPLLGQRERFEKPIFAYAPEVLIERFLPQGPFSSRRVRALLAMGLVLITASIGAQHFGARAGWCSAAVLASCLALPVTARADGTQLLATLLGWAGVDGLADATFGRRAGRDLRLVVAYGALAAAFLCAGPLPALWPMGGLALYLALAGSRDGWSQARALPGLLLLAGVGLPWYGAMSERYGGEFLAHAPFFPYGAQPAGPWYAGLAFTLAFLVIGFFPWSALLPGAALHAATGWRAARRGILRAPGEDGAAVASGPLERERREEGAAHFFIACLVAALATIALYPTPPLSAALPALPAAALLCGRLLDHLIESPERVSRIVTRAVRMLALVGSAGAVLLALTASRIREAAPELRMLGSVVLVASWAPFLAAFLGRRRLAGLLMVLPVALGAPIVSMRLLPAMEGFLNTRAAAEAMAAVSPPRAPLVLVDPAPPSLRLYLRRNLVVVRSPAELGEYPAADRNAYIAFAPHREHEVARAAPSPLEILLRSPSLVLARVRVP